MARKIRIAGGLIALAIMALSLCAAPASLASSPNSQRVLRCPVVKRILHGVIVKVGPTHRRVTVLKAHHYVRIDGKKRYKVLRRAQRYVVLLVLPAGKEPRRPKWVTPPPTPPPTPTATPTPTPTPTATPTATQAAAGHPSLVVTAADIDAIKSRIAAGSEPEASAWRHFADYYLSGPMRDAPQVFAGPAVNPGSDWDHVFDTLGQDGSKARNLAIAYVITGDQKYAVKAREYLVAWALGNTPTTQYDWDHGDPTYDHGATGYHQSYGAFSFAYAYDLTYDSGVYSDADRVTVKAWFIKFVDAIQTCNDRIASDWWISQPTRTAPYHWDATKFYYPRDTYVGGDAAVLSQTARLAMAHVVGYKAAEDNILNDSSNVLNLENMLNSALTPKNDGDGVAGHPNPVPHVYIEASWSSGGGMFDYMTYNTRALDILVTMAQNSGWSATNVADARVKLYNTWSYLARFFGPNAEPDFNPTDVINLNACLPRFTLAYHEFGGTRLRDILDSGPRATYYEPQLLGPVTLTLSIPEK